MSSEIAGAAAHPLDPGGTYAEIPVDDDAEPIDAGHGDEPPPEPAR